MLEKGHERARTKPMYTVYKDYQLTTSAIFKQLYLTTYRCNLNSKLHLKRTYLSLNTPPNPS
jgi:hypothetical protein